MVVDQIDRNIGSPPDRTRSGPVGRGVSRLGHGAAALIGRSVAIAAGLVSTILRTVRRVLRTVVRTAGTLIALVVDLAGQIVRQALGLLRRVTT
jgi:hypothetical protein